MDPDEHLRLKRQMRARRGSQEQTKGAKRSEIFSYRFGFFEFYFCLHYVLGDKACPLPDKREMSLKEFEKTG